MILFVSYRGTGNLIKLAYFKLNYMIICRYSQEYSALVPIEQIILPVTDIVKLCCQY